MATNKPLDFSPIGEKLVGMVGAARDAFNRHSLADLDKFKNLQAAASQEIGATLKKLEAQMAQAKPEDKTALTVWHNLLTGLNQVHATLSGLGEPIGKKVKDNILFSEKAVAQTNSLFDSQTGLLRSVFDLVLTGNSYLKKFVQQEGLNTQRECADFATEHETRLIEGLCTPQAAPIFLAILERFTSLGRHENDIVQNL
jgi:Na+/phosphate symporter